MFIWRYWLKLFGMAALAVFLGLVVGVGFLARRGALNYVHPVRQVVDITPTVEHQAIHLPTADGLRLAAWYTPPQNGAVILIAHGYAEHRLAHMHDLFAQQGYGVVTWDFRAHGASEGELVTFGYYEVRDVDAALSFALAQPGVKHVGLWGASMGAATAIRAAAQHPEIEAVVADSAFTTLEEELNIMVRVGFLRPLVRWFAEQEAGVSADAVRPIDVIGALSPRPILLIQGGADHTIPPDSAARLYAAAGEPKQMWIAPNAPHVGSYATHPEAYAQRVLGFFAQTLLAEQQINP